ncbi:unnamed protein product [Rodentolepis nana]|uniref:PUM-HD domain-containing protein n=1 Tax=Rodentolepis nana TaxID=102285 RepID=A0A0R3TK54_RODNA|nr:unnamed protein product [Rodentolepis nana]
MNEYPDPNAPGRPLVKPNSDQSSPSKNPCSFEEKNAADTAATKQSSLSFRGFADDPENGLSWGVEGSSNLRFGGQTSGMRFSHKSLWDSTDDYGGLPTAAVWGRGSPSAVGKDSSSDPFLAFPLGTSLLPMSPGNKDAGELSKQVTNFVLSDPNTQDASSPSVETKIPSNSQFRPQLLVAEDPSESPYLSAQENPLIQNGNVGSLSRIGHFNNIQVSMNPYGPQGPSISLDDLERLISQLSGMRMGGGTREQQQIFPPPPQSSQMHSYTSNGFFSVAQDPRPNYVYDQHQSSSAPVTTAPDLSSSGCPNIFSPQGPPVEPGFHQQQLDVSHQQQPDPYAFAAAAAAVINGAAQPNCIQFLNQAPFAGQPGSLTLPPGTFDHGVPQNQDGFYSSTTAADRLKSLAILSNGGMNVLPLQQLRVPPVASPFVEPMSQLVQIRPVQPNTISIPPPQQGAPSRSQIIDQQLPLPPSTFCYPDGSHPQSSHYVACPSPLNAPPLLTPLTFPHPNPNTPAHGDCYPLSSVTPDALSNAFPMGFTRFGQQSHRNRGGGRFNRPPLAVDACGARPSTQIRGGQSFTSGSHQQQRPLYYRNQHPSSSVNFTPNGCSMGPRNPLVSNPTPIPSQVFPSQPMMPLQSHSSLGASGHQMVVPDRSRPLDDYNRYTRIEQMSLQCMSGCFVKFSKDQTGSRLIQLKLEKASLAEKNVVFNEILPSCHELITDVFGNYVIQKFLDLGAPEHKIVRPLS